MDDLGVFASVLGHIGDGNFHESILYNKKDPKEYEAVKNCVYRMVDRAIEMDGTCTGEVCSTAFARRLKLISPALHRPWKESVTPKGAWTGNS